MPGSASAAAVVYRPALPGEHAGAEAIDNSFTTATVLEVTASDEGFRLRETPVDPPLRKVYPAEDEEGDEDAHVIVARAGDVLCGAISLTHAEWNHRLVIADLRVAPGHRGRGIGPALMERGLAHGRELGARTAWLEVTNVNAPAVRVYRRMGFALCGLDTSLYRGTASEGETALFMSRSL
ncbi:GNAT family N-acetyltransferase [Streptomyces roseoverticillatus]|uniref:GNAT family N-acetyltransferase n=1 Tax=Streptomyces roseoverticillatus TaxID=66429 RepID=UPI001F1B6E60|nr:GNAT family N-acetyltransferase [Streptomyces roseoverticillatus]MCF3102489.1 GNAT family N-acetyltransferase [Streptomyces roseoverticillatus]